METTNIANLVNELNAANAKLHLALAACRSIRFATDNAVRHGGDYSLNDLLAADKLAREALVSQMTPQFIEQGAIGLLKKFRAQPKQTAKPLPVRSVKKAARA